MDSHPGPTLAEIIAFREQATAPGDGDTAPHTPTHAPSAPHVPTRSYSSVVALDLKIGKSLPLQLERCST